MTENRACVSILRERVKGGSGASSSFGAVQPIAAPASHLPGLTIPAQSALWFPSPQSAVETGNASGRGR